jgi:hypothetical protein
MVEANARFSRTPLYNGELNAEIGTVFRKKFFLFKYFWRRGANALENIALEQTNPRNLRRIVRAQALHLQEQAAQTENESSHRFPTENPRLLSA